MRYYISDDKGMQTRGFPFQASRSSRLPRADIFQNIRPKLLTVKILFLLYFPNFAHISSWLSWKKNDWLSFSSTLNFVHEKREQNAEIHNKQNKTSETLSWMRSISNVLFCSLLIPPPLLHCHTTNKARIDKIKANTSIYIDKCFF